MKDPVRGLVLSGGGARGPYEAGVLCYLADKGHPGFDVVCGTSVGAINGAGVAHYPPSEFADAVRWIKSLWFTEVLSSKDIYKKKWFKYTRLFFGAMELFDSSPAGELLKRVIDPKKVKASGVKLRMPAFEMETKELHVFDENTPDLVTAIMCSASYPAFFPMVKYLMGTYTDGGIKEIAPLGHAIEAGATDILVILTHHDEEKGLPGNYLELIWQLIDAMSTEVLMNDIGTCELVNQLVLAGGTDKKWIDLDTIAPSAPLGDSLDFDVKLAKMRFDLGYEDARAYFQDDLD